MLSRYNADGLRIIRTARSLNKINQAAREGMRPLVKRLNPLPDIQSKYAVFQHPETGEVAVIGDYRAGPPAGFQPVLDWQYYYPHSHNLPFAAYLLPPDLENGERVYLADLIEDVIEGRWNQGDVFRLKACEAIWNGEEFKLQFDPETEEGIFIG